MDKKKLGQEPAFGFEYSTFEGTPPLRTRTYHHPMGISKRFYAACAAMQGLLANPNTANQIKSQFGDNQTSAFGYEVVCGTAYRIADELLKQEAE